jgi:pre-mRNA-processing factor 40
MNPMNAPTGPASLWQEARTPEGRAYYYNVQTKATQWTKPVELMTPVEVSEMSLCMRAAITDILPCYAAGIGQPAVERIYRGRWTEVLVKLGDKGEYMGNA